MAISIFPSTAAEFVSNNFVVDMNDTSNNTADTGGIKQAGPYSMSFSSGDSSFDVYLIDGAGNSVGYSNTTSISASGVFSTVVIFGVPQDEVISFSYQGSINNADGEGDEPGAGAYLESISPSDLPSIDDTATVIGGNFGTNTVFTFESGATVLQAKNASIVSGTEALITRPDALIEDDSPYDLKAVNPGVPTPTTKDFVLTDAVTAGSDPTWVTTSPLNPGEPGEAFSQTLEATDSDGTVVDYSVTSGTLTSGLTLNSSTGVLSGTPTTDGNFTFTVTATDDGGNQTSREFEQTTIRPFQTITTTQSVTLTEESIVYVFGGGGAGAGFIDSKGAGGGGGGSGFLATGTLSAGTYTATIGAGGSGGSLDGGDGGTSSIGGLTAAGGSGAIGFSNSIEVAGNGADGGSGGGGGASSDPFLEAAGGAGGSNGNAGLPGENENGTTAGTGGAGSGTAIPSLDGFPIGEAIDINAVYSGGPGGDSTLFGDPGVNATELSSGGGGALGDRNDTGGTSEPGGDGASGFILIASVLGG